MAIKKTVRRRSDNDGGFRLFPWLFFITKKKMHDSTVFVKKQRSDLMQSFRYAKTSTKFFVVSVILCLSFFGIASVTHSLVSISDKQAELDELNRKIDAQQKLNQELEDQLKGDLDALMEERARELDMVYPDEQIFINKAG